MQHLVTVRFFVPLFSLGALLTAVTAFGLLATDRFGNRLHTGVVTLLSLSLVTILFEAMHLYFGELRGLTDVGMQMIRLYELFATTFLVALPLFFSMTLPRPVPGRRLLGANVAVSAVVVVGFWLIAFIRPDLFISVTEPRGALAGPIQSGTASRGVPGPAFAVRDLLMVVQLCISLAVGVVAGIGRYLPGARLWIVAGIISGFTAAVGAIFANFTQRYPGPMRAIPFSRVGLAFTVFAVCSTIAYVLEYRNQARLLDSTNRELTRRRNRLAFLAYHDERTGMLNKQAFVRDMDGMLKRGRGMAFLCALDGFGDVVDSFGFAFSDRLLRLVGERVMQIAEEHGPDAGSAYHLEGDQFAILLSTPQTAESLDRFERRLMETMSEPFVADDQTVFLSASAGQYTLFGQESDAEDVLRRLKRALAEAQEHHNTVSRYSPEVHVAVASTQQLVQKLRRATHEHEFRVHYQPIIDRTGRVAAAEALLRWEPAGPEQFIVLAEQSGLIVPITEELVSIVCGDIPRMRAVSPDLKTYINISARHIGQLHLVKLLTDRLSGCTVDSGMLGVEITETSFFKEDQAVLRVMRELTGEGFSVAIDDFGTGYSSLSYLKRLPADRIKIDRSFVTDLPGSQADGALVESVISLGHRLGKKVVAEGVETEAQYQYLFRRGVDFFQGFHFASASPVDAFSVSLADSMQLGT